MARLAVTVMGAGVIALAIVAVVAVLLAQASALAALIVALLGIVAVIAVMGLVARRMVDHALTDADDTAHPREEGHI